MSRRSSAVLAVLGLLVFGVAACVEVPDTMRAEFAGPGPNDRTNYKPGPHGAAPANDTHFKISGSYDAGVEAAAPVDAAAPLVTDGGNT